jgi:hypothetical protein
VRGDLGKNQLFGVYDGFVDGVPASSVDAPVVGGVFVAIDSNLASFYFFIGVDTHNIINFYCLTS